MEVYLYLCGIGYVIFSLYLLKGWRAIAPRYTDTAAVPITSVAVIIPIRNEEAVLESILTDLLQQDYPKELLTVYLADDGSTDQTPSIISRWMEQHPNRFKKVRLLAEYETWKGKKRWIASAIADTDATFILTTDADCQLPKHWVKSMVQAYESTQAKFISGPVTITGESTIWNRFQQIEFSSLIGSGASAIGLKKPLMCNGANVGYTREAYIEVRGFEGNEAIASGDDEFLMHKMYAVWGAEAIAFCKNKMAIVSTKGVDRWPAFFNQRKRWASKWENYSLRYVQAVAFWIFIFHLTVLVSSLLAIFREIDWYLPLVLWGIKFIFDYFYLKSIARFLSIDFKKSTFIYAVLIYPIYVVGFGILARFGTYTWKERIEKLS
ncbi:glycosyltransferase [Cytophaga aurantiaca]|uniref:glycosyltransferase n=1 Tax=Cytophaga aurantiaca TaxID=29530 RepID=UPI00038292DB|nr:glycosyltransferase [Cytophaga aurantiaca]